MNIFQRAGKVRAARQRAAAARHQLEQPIAALLARERAHPLTTVGTAAGAGFVLGRLNVHPLRVPGLGALLSGGLAETVAFGARLIADLGATGLAATALTPRDRDGEERSAGPVDDGNPHE
jgi:hypothetical protein